MSRCSVCPVAKRQARSDRHFLLDETRTAFEHDMRLELSPLRASPNAGALNTSLSQWQVGAIVDAVAVRDANDGQLWLAIGNQRVPARVASGDPAGPADGERLQLKVLRDRPVLALESIPVEDAESNVVSDGLRRHLPRQSSPAPLLANLALLTKDAPLAEQLPRSVRQAVEQLWQSLPQAQELSTPEGLERALRRSGVFMEANLAKADEFEARDVLARDVKALLLSLKRVLQRVGALPQQLSPVADRRATATPAPLPTLRNTLAPLTAADASLAQAASLPDQLNELAAQADGALSRLRSVQLANAESPAHTATWLVELPLTRDQQPETLRFRFERHTPQRDANTPNEQAWTVEAALDLRDAGGLHARVSLIGSRISVQLRAESHGLAEILSASAPQLSSMLREAGLDVERIVCLQGLPTDAAQWRDATPLLDVRA